MHENIVIAAITTGGVVLSAVVALFATSAKTKELKKQNNELKNKIFNLEEENKQLKMEILKLENRIELFPEGNILYDKDKNAYCPICYGKNNKCILLQKEIDPDNEQFYYCFNCKNSIYPNSI